MVSVDRDDAPGLAHLRMGRVDPGPVALDRALEEAARPSRRWFASGADLLLAAPRRIGLCHAQLARATCGTIRAQAVEDRRGCAKACAGSSSPLASAHPFQTEYHLACLYLQARRVLSAVA
jgi:hypothetical protein